MCNAEHARATLGQRKKKESRKREQPWEKIKFMIRETMMLPSASCLSIEIFCGWQLVRAHLTDQNVNSLFTGNFIVLSFWSCAIYVGCVCMFAW